MVYLWEHYKYVSFLYTAFLFTSADFFFKAVCVYYFLEKYKQAGKQITVF